MGWRLGSLVRGQAPELAMVLLEVGWLSAGVTGNSSSRQARACPRRETEHKAHKASGVPGLELALGPSCDLLLAKASHKASLDAGGSTLPSEGIS